MTHQPHRPTRCHPDRVWRPTAGYPTAFGSAAGTGFHLAQAPERRR